MPDSPYTSPQTNPQNATSTSNIITQEPFRKLKGLSIAIIILIAFQSISSLIFRLPALNNYDHLTEEELLSTPIVLISSLFALLIGLSTLVTIVIWCIWKYKACKNAWILRSTQHKSAILSSTYSPGWSIGSYFVPFINLVVPYQAMCFIRDQAHNSGQQMKNAIGLWWAFWIISNIASTLETRFHWDGNDFAVDFSSILGISLGLLEITSAFFAIQVVRKITKTQEEAIEILKTSPPPNPQ